MASAGRPYAIIRPNNYGTLTNIRASSCYLNTSLQMLYRIHTLRFMLENINLNNPRLVQVAKINEDVARSRTILRILKHIFEKFSRGERNINLETERVYVPLVEYSGLTCGVQQDMTEFIINIIGIISTFYGNPHVKNFMDSISYNQIESKICENGKIVIRDPIVMFNDQERIGQLPKTLDLPINDRATNIQQLITIFQEVERLEPPNNILYSCVITNGRTDYNETLISKQNIIRELPSSEYCLISLKRRLPTDAYGTNYYKKRNRIESNPYLIIDNGRYQVIGCGLHTGSANGGHYVYIAYDDNGRPAVKFDDSQIYQVQQSEVELINTDAYMFLYKKIGDASAAEAAALTSTSVPLVPLVMQSPNLQEIRRKIEQIKDKIQELKINPSSEMNILGLNGFIGKAIQLYSQLSEKEKKHIGAFIPREAIQYLKIKIPDNLVL
jgi:uncharacterized UBP type Zn finger protein